MNLLFTSSGRRGYLLQCFREAMGDEGLIHASNNQALVSSFAYADKTVTSPNIYDDGYIPFLLDYCKVNEIHAIIPLFDIALPILSANKKRFEDLGVNVIVSEPGFIAVCNDKLETGRFLAANDFACPKLFVSLDTCIAAVETGEVTFPLFVKPRWGMGSIGVHKVDNMVELKFFYNLAIKEVMQSYLKFESNESLNESVVIQEQLPGKEYGLDIINDLEGNHISVFVKKKLAMRAGETDTAVTVDEPILSTLGAKLGMVSGHVGVLDVDVFFNGNQAVILDMNARFGGGYPFSHIAGADIPRAIVHWLKGEKAPEDCFRIKHGICGVKDVLPISMENYNNDYSG